MRATVVIPCYEAGSFLLDAVESVKAQTDFVLGRDLEVVVADDGSARPDSAAAVAAAAKMPGVRVLQTKGRTGPSAARNLAARHANGEWLAFLDADDLYAPEALSLRWHTAHGHAGLGCVVTDYAEFQADAVFRPAGLPGVIASTPLRRPAVQAAIDSGQTLVLDRPVQAFLQTVPMWTGSVFLRREIFEALGGFPEGHSIGEDLHLWLRIAATQRLAYVPRITAYCRKGHASLSARESEINLKTTRCFEDLLQDPVMEPVAARLRGIIAEGYRSESYFARQRGVLLPALGHALHALQWHPAALANWRALLSAPWPTRSPVTPEPVQPKGRAVGAPTRVG
jgi:glycosyltransferase involved in cell wall biosynthesis